MDNGLPEDLHLKSDLHTLFGVEKQVLTYRLFKIFDEIFDIFNTHG